MAEQTSTKGFRGLRAWQSADDLASAVYRALNGADRKHAWLASQATRAAISVPANIAEGYGRGSIGDYVRFLDIARGSLAELDYFLHFFSRERVLGEPQLATLRQLHEDTARMLHGLWKALKAKSKSGGWDHTGRIAEGPPPYGTLALLAAEPDTTEPMSDFPIPNSAAAPASDFPIPNSPEGPWL